MATYFFRNSGTDWGTAANWSLSSGGPANGAVPLVTDDVIFDDNSGNCSVVGTRVCRDLTTTSYTNTITITFLTNQGLDVNRNLTLGSSTIIAGTGYLSMSSASGILDLPVGYVLSNLNVISSGTITLVRSVTITTLRRTLSGTATILPQSGSMTITINNGLHLHANNGVINFGANVTLLYTGNTTIDNIIVGGNITLVSGTLSMIGNCRFGVGTVNLSAGTLNAGTSTYTLNAATHTLITGTNSLWNLAGGATTLTISSNLNILNLLSASMTTVGAFDIIVSNTIGGTNVTITTPNRKIILTGSSGQAGISLNGVIFNFISTTVEIDCGPNTFSTSLTNNGQVNINTNSSLNYISGVLASFLDLQITGVGSINMGTSQVGGVSPWRSILVFGTLTINSELSFRDITPAGGTFTASTVQRINFSRNITGAPNTQNLVNIELNCLNGFDTGTANSIINGVSGINRFIINKSSNTLFVNNAITFTNINVDYVSGIINQTANVTFNNCTLNLNGAIFNGQVTCTNTNTLISLLEVSGTLITGTSCRFAGTAGFRTNVLNISNNTILEAGITYSVYGNLTMIGTAAARRDLRSSQQAVFVGTASGTTLTRSSGAVPTVGMTLGGNLNTAIPTGLGNLLPNRPVINGGVNPNFTLDLSVTPTTGNVTLIAGNKAILILENSGTQNVVYVTCQDIDSSTGNTILAFGSVNDNAGVTLPNIYRTLNWGELVAPRFSNVDTFIL